MAESITERELRKNRREEMRTLEELRHTKKELSEMKERLASEEMRVEQLLAERSHFVETENADREGCTSRPEDKSKSGANVLLDPFGGGTSVHGTQKYRVMPPSARGDEAMSRTDSVLSVSTLGTPGDEALDRTSVVLGESTLPPDGDVRRKTVLDRQISEDSVFTPSGDDTHADGNTVSFNLTDRRESILRDFDRLCGVGGSSPEDNSTIESTPLGAQTYEEKLKRGRQLLDKQRKLKAKEQLKKLKLQVETEKKRLEEEQRLKTEREIEYEIHKLRDDFEKQRQCLARDSRLKVEREILHAKEKFREELDEQRRLLEKEHTQIVNHELDEEKDRVQREMEKELRALKEEQDEIKNREKQQRDLEEEEKLRKQHDEETERKRIHLGKPKLPDFDGNQYDEWKVEIVSLLETNIYSECSLKQVVRNSITGKARKVLLTLPPSATTSQILKKMEDLYGNIRSGDSIVYDFYAAKQEKSEPCSDWGIRLETLFNKAVERSEVLESRKDVKLKERFWRGLHTDKIREATRNCFESTENFDQLRRKARIEELETSTVKPVHAHRGGETSTETKEVVSVTSTTVDSKYDALLNKINSLEISLQQLKSQSSSERGNYSYRGRYPYRHKGDRRQNWRDNRRDDNSASRWKDDKSPNTDKSGSQKDDKPKESTKAEPKKEGEAKEGKKSLNE